MLVLVITSREAITPLVGIWVMIAAVVGVIGWIGLRIRRVCQRQSDTAVVEHRPVSLMPSATQLWVVLLGVLALGATALFPRDDYGRTYFVAWYYSNFTRFRGYFGEHLIPLIITEVIVFAVMFWVLGDRNSLSRAQKWVIGIGCALFGLAALFCPNEYDEYGFQYFFSHTIRDYDIVRLWMVLWAIAVVTAGVAWTIHQPYFGTRLMKWTIWLSIGMQLFVSFLAFNMYCQSDDCYTFDRHAVFLSDSFFIGLGFLLLIIKPWKHLNPFQQVTLHVSTLAMMLTWVFLPKYLIAIDTSYIWEGSLRYTAIFAVWLLVAVFAATFLFLFRSKSP